MPETYEIDSPYGPLEWQGDHQPTQAEALTAVRAFGDHMAAQAQARTFPQGQPPSLGKSENTVTLGDLRENPTAALMKIGDILKKDATDPKLWTSLVASYFAPKMVGAALATVGPLARAAGAVAKNPTAAVGVLSPRLRSGIELAQDVRTAMRPPPEPAPAPAPAAPAAAPTSAPSLAGNNLQQAIEQAIASGQLRAKPATPASAPVAAPVATPPAVAAAPVASTPDTAAPQSTAGSPPSLPHPTRSPGEMSPQWIQNDLAIQARRSGVKLSAEQYQQAEGLVRGGQSIDEAVQAVVPRTGATPPAVPKAKIVASEVPEYLKLIRSGKTPQQAYEAIQAQRDLMEAYGLSTPTAAQTRFPKGMRGKSVIP